MTTTTKTKTAYRVYHAPEGCDESFCGERETRSEAEALAASEPGGLPRSLWDTARAAGHCAGLTAPDARGVEDEEPLSWHGAAGEHCVVRVTYQDDSQAAVTVYDVFRAENRREDHVGTVEACDETTAQWMAEQQFECKPHQHLYVKPAPTEEDLDND